MPKFTKQHYEIIAGILHDNYPVKSDLETEEGFRIRKSGYHKLVNRLSREFNNDNERFDVLRFLEAIDVNGFYLDRTNQYQALTRGYME